jgi:nucleotide-binding universal stress UspA family protein
MAFKKILVPVDFSESSDSAVEYAVFIARKFGAEITLLHAILLYHDDIDEEEHMQAYEKIIRKKEKQSNKKLESHFMTAKDQGLKVKYVLIRAFAAADSILNYISENDFDLVVMGTHGRTGLKKWILGSVTEKVVRLSTIPVLTVHKEFHKKKISKILVPVDFSEYSQIAVKRATAVAEEFKAKLEFLHVVEMEAHPEFYSMSFEPLLKANPHLNDHIIENLIKLTGIPQDRATYAVREGKVHNEIKIYAETNQIDLIVMANRGMSDLEHLVLGSNSERVVRVASCPVLTVREKV